MPAHRRTIDHHASQQDKQPGTTSRTVGWDDPNGMAEPSTYQPISDLKWAKDTTFVMVDLRHLAYRAFYTIDPAPSNTSPKTMTARIMLDSLAALADAANTHRFLLIDDGGLEYKRRAHPGYKDRKDKEDDADKIRERETFRFHFDTAVKFFKSNNIPIAHVPFLEADDTAGLAVGYLIASNGVAETANIERLLLVTDDKDYYQLLSKPAYTAQAPARVHRPEVLIWRGVRKEVANTESFTKRHGFPPDLYPHYKALVGEGKTGDNIPGVPGIGDVTGGKMVAAHRNLESIIAFCKQASAGGKAKAVERAVVTHEENARLSLRLSTITKDANDLKNLWGIGQADADAAISIVSYNIGLATTTRLVNQNVSALLADGVNPIQAQAALSKLGSYEA